MKVKLNQDQHYINIEGYCHCGLKGDIVDIDDTFFKLIKDVCEVVIDKEENADEKDVIDKKPVNQKNKKELKNN